MTLESELRENARQPFEQPTDTHPMLKIILGALVAGLIALVVLGWKLLGWWGVLVAFACWFFGTIILFFGILLSVYAWEEGIKAFRKLF
ncbi:MAG: hypothetical protein PHI63_05885 [Patescibacteria group bacterium]|nr:hypothetical protein [Patescibacteria group bacterium]